MSHHPRRSTHARHTTDRLVLPSLMALTGIALFLFAHPAAGIATISYAGLAFWVENKRPAAPASALVLPKGRNARSPRRSRD